jgi:hypothetical protein
LATITFIVDSLLPPGWQLEHIVRLGDADWQVQLSSGGTPPLVIATGSFPEEAVRNAASKALVGDYYKVLAQPTVSTKSKPKPTLSDL